MAMMGSTALVDGPGSRSHAPGPANLRDAPLVIGGAAASSFFPFYFFSFSFSPPTNREGGGALSWPRFFIPSSVGSHVCV